MDALINWLNSLQPWQNILVSVFFVISLVFVVTFVCAWVFKSIEQKTYTVKNLPTETDLRNREEAETRAFKIFTSKKGENK